MPSAIEGRGIDTAEFWQNLCLEADKEFKPGTTLFIRRGSLPTVEQYDVNWKHLRQASLGEVRWCRGLEDNFGTYYCIGLRYC